MASEPLARIGEGEILIGNRYLSVDPGAARMGQ